MPNYKKYNPDLQDPRKGFTYVSRELQFNKWVKESENEINYLERLIILLAKAGRRDLQLEIDLRNETDYFLQLTKHTP